jgi:hypothetical protein
MKLSIPLPDPLYLVVELPGDQEGQTILKTFRVEPATRDQVRRTLALDPQEEDEVDPIALEAARAQQVKILTERSGHVTCEDPLQVDWAIKLPCELLAPSQSGQICRAMLHHHLGQDPIKAETVHQLKKNVHLLGHLLRSAQNGTPRSEPPSASDSTDKPSSSPSTGTSQDQTLSESGT